MYLLPWTRISNRPDIYTKSAESAVSASLSTSFFRLPFNIDLLRVNCNAIFVNRQVVFLALTLSINYSHPERPFTRIQDYTGTIFYLSTIIPFSAFALFCVLAQMIKLYLEEIYLRIKDLLFQWKHLPFRSVVPFPDIGIVLLTLKRQHFLVYKAVQQTNRSFGPCLLIYTAHIFVGATNNFMLILEGAMDEDWLSVATCGFIVLTQLIQFLIITSSADSIGSEVFRVLLVFMENKHNDVNFVF